MTCSVAMARGSIRRSTSGFGRRSRPLRVGWSAPPRSAADARAYEAYFGVPVLRMRSPTVVSSAEDAERPFLTANHGVWSVFEPALRQRLADLERHATTVERVRGARLEVLPAGELSMLAVSVKPGLSSRRRQRRLKGEGSSFQQTLDAVRWRSTICSTRRGRVRSSRCCWVSKIPIPSCAPSRAGPARRLRPQCLQAQIAQ